MKPTETIVHCDTSGVQPVMSYIAQAVRPRPINSRMRVSTLPISRPTTNMQSHRAEPARPHDDAGGDDRIAHQRLQIGRHQRQRGQIGDADDEDEEHADGKVAVEEQARIDEGFFAP